MLKTYLQKFQFQTKFNKFHTYHDIIENIPPNDILRRGEVSQMLPRALEARDLPPRHLHDQVKERL